MTRNIENRKVRFQCGRGEYHNDAHIPHLMYATPPSMRTLRLHLTLTPIHAWFFLQTVKFGNEWLVSYFKLIRLDHDEGGARQYITIPAHTSSMRSDICVHYSTPSHQNLLRHHKNSGGQSIELDCSFEDAARSCFG